MRGAVIGLLFTAFMWCSAADLHRHRHEKPVVTMKATAFAEHRHRTAAGTGPRRGIVAADPNVLPLGSKIRIYGADGYSGDYLVTDTGSAVKGHHIDLFMPSRREAREFGIHRVIVEILHLGRGREDARERDQQARLDESSRQETR